MATVNEEARCLSSSFPTIACILYIITTIRDIK